jgi:hypothetical protein
MYVYWGRATLSSGSVSDVMYELFDEANIPIRQPEAQHFKNSKQDDG